MKYPYMVGSWISNNVHIGLIDGSGASLDTYSNIELYFIKQRKNLFWLSIKYDYDNAPIIHCVGTMSDKVNGVFVSDITSIGITKFKLLSNDKMLVTYGGYGENGIIYAYTAIFTRSTHN